MTSQWMISLNCHRKAPPKGKGCTVDASRKVTLKHQKEQMSLLIHSFWREKTLHLFTAKATCAWQSFSEWCVHLHSQIIRTPMLNSKSHFPDKPHRYSHQLGYQNPQILAHLKSSKGWTIWTWFQVCQTSSYQMKWYKRCMYQSSRKRRK